MAEMNPHDEALLEALRAVVGRVDPVPGAVDEFARAALDFRSVDAELAELVYDSAADAGQALAVRGGTAARMLSFEAGELTIELEIVVAGDRRELRGLIIPPFAADIEVRHREGVTPVSSDAMGRFHVTGLPAGPASLRLRLDPEAGAGTIETEWLPL